MNDRNNPLSTDLLAFSSIRETLRKCAVDLSTPEAVRKAHRTKELYKVQILAMMKQLFEKSPPQHSRQIFAALLATTAEFGAILFDSEPTAAVFRLIADDLDGLSNGSRE
jgi:hypothetical protein